MNFLFILQTAIWSKTTCCLTFAITLILCGPSFDISQSAFAFQSSKNSNKTQRIKPTSYSSNCGSSIQWRADIDAAFADSKTTSKPVFWYVPTIDGTFMDRKPVIDQYMLSGPFAWPSICKVLNEHFIPVKGKPTRAQQREYDLKRYKFVEPGIVILDSDGKLIHSIDQLTTLDPHWMIGLFADWAGIETPLLGSPELSLAWNAFRAGNYDFDVGTLAATQDSAAEKILLTGMFAFRNGEHEQAKSIWRTAQEFAPDSSLSWKAAAEAENWGPFVRGFEVHRELPPAAYQAGRTSRGSASPSEIYSADQLWNRSVDYLLSMQADSGAWVDSDYDFGGVDSLPNVYVAVTALCGNALIASVKRETDMKRQASTIDAINRAADYCSIQSNLNVNDSDEILWANAYRVRFLSGLSKADWLSEERREQIREALKVAVTDLQSIQTPRGSWYHEYANSFVTATALTALKVAESAGATIDQDMIQRGVASLANDRFDNGAFPYYGTKTQRDRSGDKSSGEGKIQGSAGRMPLCELALWQWDASNDERLQTALKTSFEYHRHLEVSYKYDNHTSTLAYGGFFFWYDMRARAEAISYITDVTLQKEMADKHMQLVMQLPELDGCFVDSHELGRCYGTAMALQTMATLESILHEQ